MKKLIALLLAVMMLVGLVACASTAKTETPAETANTDTPAETTPAETTDEAPAETAKTDYKIGVPRRGKYDEVFSSDETRFGGSGTRNGQLYTKQTPMHGRKYCLSLTIPAFSTICLYKKASAAKKPIVETKGKSAPHGEEEKKTATRRVKAAAETVAETAKKPEAPAKKETKAGKAAAPAEKETVKKETKATKAKKSPAPAEKAAKEEKAKKPSSRKTKKV